MGTIIEAVGVAGAERGRRRASSVELAASAARDAIQAAGCEPGDIGLLVNTGVYRDENICEPAIAPFIQRRIGLNPSFSPGAPTTFSFDIQNGVCGLLTGLQVVDGFLSSGVATRALLVASDIDPTPGVSEGLEFAPVGAAILLRATEGVEGFSAFHSETIGKHSNLFDGHVAWIGEGRSRLSLSRRRNHAARIRQGDGFVARCADCAARSIEGFLAARELALDDVDLVVPSASPSGFAEAVAERIDASGRVVTAFPTDLGLPHSAGPGVALAAAMSDARYQAARNVLLVAAGAGITVGLALYSKTPHVARRRPAPSPEADALVTGATGFIGSHVAERLVERGKRVRALVRDTSDVGHLRSLGVELVPGSLEDEASLARACRGASVVYHNAARVGDWGPRAEFFEVDARGTERLVDAAVHAGASRFVHMSSVGVYGFFRIRDRHVTEELPVDPRPWRWDYYGRAKAAAERVVRDAQRKGQIETVILRPSIVYGPRDRMVVPRLARLLQQRKLRLIGSGENRLHLVYVGDVAEAAARAGSSSRAAGGIYNLDGRRECTQRELFEAVAELCGEPPPTKSLPLEAAYLLALASEAWGHLSRQQAPPALTRYLVVLARGETDFDLSRAKRDLDWEPRTAFEQGMRCIRESDPYREGRGAA